MADGNITVEVSTQAATAELRRLRVENAALKRDLEYARGGLTKGRTRMREDVTRLQAEVEQLRAENAALTLELRRPRRRAAPERVALERPVRPYGGGRDERHDRD